MSTAMAGSGEPDFLSALVESLPGAAFVIDSDGAVRFATRSAAELVDRDPADVIGRSVLEFVDEDTAWAYAAAVAMAIDYPHVVMGPLRITIVRRDGSHRTADLWASNRTDDPVVAGIVCLLTPETTAVGLAEAVNAITAAAPFVTVAARVVRAMRGHPTTSESALLSAGVSGFRTVASSTDELPSMDTDGPWTVAVETNTRQLPATLDDLPPQVAEDARRLGFGTVWVEPVGSEGTSARGALVLWRALPGRPTPNELNAMHQGAAIVALAWERHDAAS
jgi:PAS domain S-box-containing protein